MQGHIVLLKQVRPSLTCGVVQPEDHVEDEAWVVRKHAEDVRKQVEVLAVAAKYVLDVIDDDEIEEVSRAPYLLK